MISEHSCQGFHGCHEPPIGQVQHKNRLYWLCKDCLKTTQDHEDYEVQQSVTITQQEYQRLVELTKLLDLYMKKED